MHTEAAVLVGPAQVEVQEFPLPAIGHDDGLMEVEACGVCGSDIRPFLDGGGALGAYRKIELPVILGHEMVGRIAQVGASASNRWGVVEGDRVVVERWMPCGRCDACQRGAFASCVRSIDGYDLFYGGTPTLVSPGLWGGFARHMYLHPDTVMHKVSSSGPASPYSLFLPLANAVEWVQHTGGARIGSTLLIQGPGPIGLMCVLVARAAGARTVIVSGLTQDSDRLRLAESLGATAAVDANQDDVVARCKELTGGEGVDVVVDATSAPSLVPISIAVDAAKAGGLIVVATEHPGGEHGGRALGEIMTKIQTRTLTVTGVRGRGRPAAGVALKLLDDPQWVDGLSQLCTPKLGLGELAAGFDALLSGQGLHASVVPGR